MRMIPIFMRVIFFLMIITEKQTELTKSISFPTILVGIAPKNKSAPFQ